MRCWRTRVGKWLVVGVALALGTAFGASASSEVGRSRRSGLGLILGEPTGITGKYYLSDYEKGHRHAVDGAFGLGWVYGNAIHVHADYLWEFESLVRNEDFDLPWYMSLSHEPSSKS